MVWGAHQYQPVLAERDDGDLRSARRIGDDADIDAPGQHVVENLARPAVLQVDVHLRVGLEELLERFRELVQADAVHGGDTNAAAHRLPEALQLLAEVAIATGDVLARLIEQLAGGSRLHVPLGALDQRLVEAGLECPHLLAHRRLRDEILRRGGGEAAGFDEIAEYLQGLEVHRSLPDKMP